jgi:hypothetical protein
MVLFLAQVKEFAPPDELISRDGGNGHLLRRVFSVLPVTPI